MKSHGIPAPWVNGATSSLKPVFFPQKGSLPHAATPATPSLAFGLVGALFLRVCDGRD